jgi:dCMP deaminase
MRWVGLFSIAMDEKEIKPYGARQLQFDKRYLEMARIWSKNSYCKRKQVGALIVKGRMIISDGFNGTPAGFENVCEDEEGHTKPYVLHAEANAITKVAKSGNSSENATLYVTTSPCIECSKLIIQAGIRRVVFAELYHDDSGLRLLRKAGIEVVQLKEEE